MAKPEGKDIGKSGNSAAYAIPVLAQIAGTIMGNEFFNVAASLAIAVAYLRMGWDAGVLVASGAAGLIIAAAFFSQPGVTANAAANSAYWIVSAGVLALALEQMKSRGGIGMDG
jgi:Mg2+/Co2+ transporter CorB